MDFDIQKNIPMHRKLYLFLFYISLTSQFWEQEHNSLSELQMHIQTSSITLSNLSTHHHVVTLQHSCVTSFPIFTLSLLSFLMCCTLAQLDFRQFVYINCFSSQFAGGIFLLLVKENIACQNYLFREPKEGMNNTSDIPLSSSATSFVVFL